VTQWNVPDDRERATPERIRAFLDRYEHTDFRHGEEFLGLLRRDDLDGSRIHARDAQLDEGLRVIYRIRAKTTAQAPKSPFYPPGLADDVRDLSLQLDSARDQPLCSWSVELPSGIGYLLFELLDDQRVAGCVKSADQRVVNPREV
jgi:hypothetical protein